MSQQINLFNPIFLKQKKHFSAVTMVQGLGLILIGSIAVFGYAKLQLVALNNEVQATSGQLVSAQAQLVKVTADFAAREKNKALEEEIRRAEAELNAHRHMLDVVSQGGFGNTRGYSEYMTAFARQSIHGLWLTGFSIDGNANEIELSGRALKPDLVPAYINRLRQEPTMRGKSFSTLAMATPANNAADRESPATAGGPTDGAQSAAGYIEFTLKSFKTVQDRVDAGSAPFVQSPIKK